MEALSRDPSFRQAEQHLEETRVLSSGIEDVAELDRLVPRDIQRRPEGTVLDHTLHLADVLNQGFLPGVDRRKPIEEQNQSFFGSAADFEFRVLIPQR
jgi:hypothetical protein